jgi:predicted thioesterase
MNTAWQPSILPRGFATMSASLRETTMAPEELKPGLKGEAELVVGEEHTALRVGSGRVRVFATPLMIALMESAAVAAVEDVLAPGQQSVGTHLDVRHLAATPVGLRVRAAAELVKVDGRLLTFHVTAADEKEPIGEGTHVRALVDAERFDARLQAKLEQSGPSS